MCARNLADAFVTARLLTLCACMCVCALRCEVCQDLVADEYQVEKEYGDRCVQGLECVDIQR